jgi:hypothetical protein
MTVKLTPPDLKQCQADVPGNGPFTIGGEIGNPRNGYRIRCKNKPTVIATEKRVAADGLQGSMSLCESCRAAFLKQLGPDYAAFEDVLPAH